MKVYLFRHGQKQNNSFGDPDLTDYGHRQAASLSEGIRRGDFVPGTQFLASPRIRAQSTLRPSAEHCKTKVQVLSDLDQREGFESSDSFRARIQQLLYSLEKRFKDNDVVYLCSHHDWIEEALSVIPADTDLLESKYWSWSPAQFMEFDIVDGVWNLKRFHQVKLD